MSNQTFKNPVFISIVSAILSAIVTAITTKVLSGQIDYSLVVTVIFIAILVVIIVFYFYRTYFRFPFQKWRVEKTYKDEDGKDKKLIASNSIFEGVPVDKAWEFKAKADDWHIIGPYIYLPKGKYTVKFKIKVDYLVTNQRILNIDVASRCQQKGDKILAKRTLTTRDFILGNDRYQIFVLTFEVFKGEPDVELRIYSYNSGHIITVDYINLIRETDALIQYFLEPVHLL